MATVSNFAVIFLLPYFLTLSFANGDDLLITTKDGQVQGKLLPVLSGTVRGFLGIPYANPPLGQLRFRAPEPVNAWQGVKNATSYSNTCTQLVDKSFPGFSGAEMWNPNTPLSEDCLYLNVWAPRVNKTQNSTLAPVMVWIYGGGFTSGTSSLELYDGRYLVKSEGVIVVSMNYRVGALGFLSLPDNPNIPGNAGLMDQRLALKWVVNNIAAFGGDPSKVTLFGESTGALSVGFHLVSPGSNGLFQRAIMESGSPTASWSTVSLAEAWRRATKLGMLLGCSTNAAELESCLQNADAAHIATVQHGVMTNPRISDIAFAPVIDGDFFPDDVDVLLSSPSLPKKEVLLGVNHDEGTYFLVYSVPGIGITSESLINRTQFLHGVDIMFRLKYNLTKETIIFQYTDWADKQNGTKNRDSLNRMLSDFMFICPTQDFAYRYAKNGGMPFSYYFVHQSSVNPWPAWMGVMHGYEIEFVFGNPLNPSLGYTQPEVNMSKRFMKYWANFARTGYPLTHKCAVIQIAWDPQKGLLNSLLSFRNPDGNWPLFTPENKEYVVLDTKAPETKLDLRANACEFWNTLLPQIRTMEANQQNSRANQFTLCSTYIFFVCVSAVLYTL